MPLPVPLPAASFRPAAARRFPPTPQVTGAAVAFLAWRGFQFSWQFEAGQKWERYTPGLQPGTLLGRRVVRGVAAGGLLATTRC